MNNIVEYKACILGLETTLELKIRQMEMFGDSNLVLRQIRGHWKIRDVKFRPYYAYLELLVGRFDYLNIIRKISPKSSSGHEFILVVIDYFTKWVKVASYSHTLLLSVWYGGNATIEIEMGSLRVALEQQISRQIRPKLD
ncbi:hypothetical protein AAG906_012093 [Vitis piasezkii]